MISIEFKSRKSNTYELRVRIILSGLKECFDIESAKNNFTYNLSRQPRQSFGSPSDFYKLKEASEKSFEVWHRKCNGDLDRLVAVVKEEDE